MEWIAKYYDNVYLLTDEVIDAANDIVISVDTEDNTMVVDYRSLNNAGTWKSCKVIWCYEPGEKLAGISSWTFPIITRVSATTIGDDLVSVQPMESPVDINFEYISDWFNPIEL